MEQELVIGARVVHEEFGEGVIKEIHPQRFLSYLVQFDNEDDRLHNSCGYAKGEYPDRYMYWFNASELAIAKVIPPTPKTESQQLVDILVQLGFENRYDEDYPYDYYSKKLNVWWNDFEDVVCNYCLKKNNDYISKINDESVATNIAYFQKKLNKKLKKAAAKQASQSQVEVAIVEEQKVSEHTNVEQVTESKQVKLMKLPQINWTNRIANYDMVMEELRKNEFRPSKISGNHCYYWKYNPSLVIYASIYSWYIIDLERGGGGTLTEFGSVDKFRSELAKALKATPKRFKLKKDGK